MSLQPGVRLGPYEVQCHLGAGGMGEVYRARDTKLGRDVALKILPDLFATDPERLARFEREAKVLASLNHPNIAQIHGLEDADGVKALVLELVEGPTLADRIAQGPIAVDEALPIAKQIAEALEAAHEHGIIHRDLKPANIKVRDDGTVKVLDFGLAKALGPPAADADPANSPTITSPATHVGVILGTAAYMAPEQAKGRPIDKRVDIWAFGAVVYEILTAHRAFPGEDVSDTLAAVLRADPDWTTLPSTTPIPIRRLLRRCLAKDARQRLHDIADARIEIEGALAEPWAELTRAEEMPFWRRALPVVFMAAVLLVVAGLLWQFQRPEPSVAPSLTAFVLALEAGQELASGPSLAIAISPDGTQVAYAAGYGADTALYLHALNAFDATPMPGTSGALGPFFSADGQWVGFYSKSTLFKVPVSGGNPEKICDASWGFPGASWGADGTIVFGTSEGGLRRCAASGGAAETLTTPDVSRDELRHGFPQILPDGDHVLFTAATAQGGRLAVLSLESGEWHTLNELGEAANAQYFPTGHLVYGRGGSVLAVPFDVRRLEPEGQSMEVRNAVFNDTVTGFTVHHFALSENGTLVYVPGSTDSAELVWVDRRGNVVETVSEERGNLGPLRLSPDNRRLAVTEGSADGAHIWVYDLDRGGSSRLTTRDVINVTPVWTPDGRRIAFTSDRGGSMGSYWQSADGVGEPEPLAVPEAGHVYAPRDWSPDGTLLLIEQAEPGYSQGSNLWVLSKGAREPEAYIATEFDERTPRFSPNGRWVAYISDRTGRFEVYVQSYAGPTERHQISTAGGTEPVWSSDGRELFYRWGDQMMVVEISAEPTFAAGKPKLLFETRFEHTAMLIPSYDVALDGQRFVMVHRSKEAAPTQINLVLNWFEELKAKVPTGR